MKSYIVISTESGLKLRQQPEIAPPDYEDVHPVFIDQNKYDQDHKEYEQYLASLETIDIPNEVTCWKEGDLVKEGEFEIKRGKQTQYTDQRSWQEMSRDEKDYYFEQLAIPKEQPQEKESELWKEIWMLLVDEKYDNGTVDLNKITKTLITRYHITKKQE